MIAEIVVASIAGSVVGWTLRGPRKPKEAPAPAVGSVPLAALVKEFREFAREVEGGVLPVEVEDAIKALEAHASTKALPAGRPMLEGEALAEYKIEDDAARTATERFEVIQRWHAKGYKFSFALRKELLAMGSDKATRNIFRRMFDEQDGAAPTVSE